MTMSEVPNKDGQLNRVEKKVDQVLDRLARMEERQDSQGAQIESHKVQLADQNDRLRELEIQQAVTANESRNQDRISSGRWSMLWSIGLLCLGAVIAVAERVISALFLGG